MAAIVESRNPSGVGGRHKHMQRFAAIIAFALVAAACGGSDTAATTTPPPPQSPVVTSPSAPEGGLVACSAAAAASAPEDWYRDTPVYVGNEQPVEAVAAWAGTRPGYQAIWVDREHNGWITVAFTSDAVERQRELLDEFPGVGVVAVEVGWSVAGLRTLQDQVVAHLSGLLDSFGVATLETKGIVEISVGRRERAAYLERLARHRGRLHENAMRHGMELHHCSSDTPLEQILQDHLLRGMFLSRG